MKKLFAILIMTVVCGGVRAADTLRVSGTVTDASTGEPLFGVRVSAATTTTLTDEQGTFLLAMPKESAELTVSLVGYRQRVVSASGRSRLHIKLYDEHLTEGRHTEDIYAERPAVTVDEMLTQHFGGDVRTTHHSGQTAMGAAMFVRGYHSLSGNSQPLIVVDGTPWNTMMQQPSAIGGYLYNPLQTIDPADIASIEVLKDASTIYGAKGAAGAILITTKRSQTMATKIGLDVTYGFNWRPSLPEVMNADQHRVFMTEMMKGAGLSSDDQRMFEKTLLTDDRTSIYYNRYHNNTDWNDAIYHTGNTQRYGINVQGGDNIALYMLSLSYTTADQTLRGTDYDRLSTRINSDITLSKRLTIGSDIAFGYVTRNLMDDGINALSSPTYIAATKSPLFSAYRWKNDGSAMTGTLSDVDELGIANPVAIISNGVAENKQYRLTVAVHPVYKLTDHLTLSDRFAYMLDNSKEHLFVPRTGTPVYKIADIDIDDAVSDQTVSQNELVNQARVDYDHTFGRSHHLKAALDWRLQSATYKNTLGQGYNTAGDDLSNLTGSLAAQQLDGLHDTWRNSAVTLSGDYTYRQRYRLWTTLALEGSSRFGSEARSSVKLLGGRYAFFPSVGGEWTVCNERFMSQVPGIDRLSLHASAGLSGSDDIGRQGKTSYLLPVNFLGSAYGLVLGAPVNKRLKWETTRKMDVGITAALLDERLQVAVDYYNHLTTDLITYRNNMLVNSGSLRNEGFEVTVDGKVVVNRHIGWSTTLSAAHNSNSYGGRPVGVFYGYRTEGVFASDAQAAQASPYGYLKQVNEDTSVSCFKAGDIHFTDLNGDGYIDENDMTVIGSPTPDLTGVFANHLMAGRWALDINFTYSLGGDIYNRRRQMLESMTDMSNQSKAVTRRWRMDGQHTDIPRATYGDPMGNSRISDRWIEDGSYLKLREVRLSYTWPIHRYIEGITLWAAATNLYTWTRYLGSDPETAVSGSPLSQGIDYGLLTAGRSLYFGAKINL